MSPPTPRRRGGRPRTPIRVPRPTVTPPVTRRRPGVGSLWVLGLVIVMLMGTLIGRLGQLQLLDSGDAGTGGLAHETREVVELPVRGSILTADGLTLAGHASVTVVTVEPELLLAPDEGRALVTELARALELPFEQVWGRTRLCGTPDAPPVPQCFSGSVYQPIVVAEGVSDDLALAVLERPEVFAGVNVEGRPVRDHATEINAVHLLGYLGVPTALEVESGEAASPDSLVGRTGLEEQYEEVLRGVPGQSVVQIDPRGVVTDVLEFSDPQPGQDLVTHLDSRIQRAAEEALQEAVDQARADDWPADAAAAVVMEVDTGAVVAMASWPNYDPQTWVGGISQADFEALTSEESGRPLSNRAIGETYPPGSTFKVVTMPAAMRHGVNPAQEYPCPGAVFIGDQRFENFEGTAYGDLTFTEIMQVSCDTAFYQWSFANWQDIGGIAQAADVRDPYVLLAQDFRLGQTTGVDLPGEVPGLIPSREWKREYWEATREQTCARAESGYPEVEDEDRREFLEQMARENCEDGWAYRAGDAVNFSIGQGEVSTTPLQVAVMYAAIANGGSLVRPQIAAQVRDIDGAVQQRFEPEVLGDVGLLPEELAQLQAGLEAVNVGRGTGAAAFAGFDLEAYQVAGKTGSSEAFGRLSTGWYASYGPVQDPKYAVVVVVDQGGFGGQVAAPAVRQIWDVIVDLEG